MFGLSKAEKDLRAAQAAEKDAKTLRDRKEWIGRVLVGAQSMKISYGAVGPGNFAYEVVEAKSVSGIVEDVGLRTICVGGEWYELNKDKVGGIRIIEILPRQENVVPMKKAG